MIMAQCKKGDPLLLRNGKTATAILISHPVLDRGYPHVIDIDGILQSVTEEGLKFYGSPGPFDVVDFSPEYKELIDKVIEQIKTDDLNIDIAIAKFLKRVPQEVLKSYLSKEGE